MKLNNKNQIQNLFISMLEKVSNGKINVLDFGDDFVFTRGEMHIIKRLGDFPGIYNSEIANLMGVTRAVSNKMVNRLVKRKFIYKEEDPNNKRAKKLYLTDKGKKAYEFHEQYHEESDKEFIDYISSLDENSSATIREFLEKANIIVDNHF